MSTATKAAILLRRTAAPAIGAMLIGLALLLGAAPKVHADGGGETINVAVPGRVTCVDSTGTALGDTPNLNPGDKVTCTLGGFGATEQIDITLTSRTTRLGTVTTDASGGATYDFTVPSGLSAGSYTLTFTGEKSKAVGTLPFTVGVLTTTTTTESSTESATTSAGSTETSTGSGGSPSNLAWTGVNVLAPVSGALALIAAGVLLTLANRRRRQL